jgi:hypothetical protein
MISNIAKGSIESGSISGVAKMKKNGIMANISVALALRCWRQHQRKAAKNNQIVGKTAAARRAAYHRIWRLCALSRHRSGIFAYASRLAAYASAGGIMPRGRARVGRRKRSRSNGVTRQWRKWRGALAFSIA